MRKRWRPDGAPRPRGRLNCERHRHRLMGGGTITNSSGNIDPRRIKPLHAQGNAVFLFAAVFDIDLHLGPLARIDDNRVARQRRWRGGLRVALAAASAAPPPVRRLGRLPAAADPTTGADTEPVPASPGVMGRRSVRFLPASRSPRAAFRALQDHLVGPTRNRNRP